MAGKSLVTGILTINEPSSTCTFKDAFSTNAAVAFTNTATVYTPYNFTAASVTVGNDSPWYIGYDGGTGASSSPTVTIAGGITITGASALLYVFGGTLNVGGVISQTATGGQIQFGSSVIKLPVTVSCTTLTVGNGNSINSNYSTTINLSGTGTVWNIGTTVTPTMQLSTINIVNTSATAVTFAGGGGLYRDVIFNRAASLATITITNSNNFVNLRDLGTAAHTLQFGGGTTNNILGTFDVHGSPSNPITLTRSSAAATYLQKNTGLVLCDYVSVNLLNALDYTGLTANGVFYAGPNSGVTGSTGWNTGGKVRAQSALGAG